MRPVRDGRFFLFAAAFPRTNDPFAFLLPDPDVVQVAASQVPLDVESGRAEGPANLMLRPIQTVDPPRLVTLPLLLSEEQRGPQSWTGAYARLRR
jgi:hypothetical protein